MTKGATRTRYAHRPTLADPLARLAPVISLAILIGLSILLPNHVQGSREGSERMVVVAASLNDVPRFIDGWTGIDFEVPREAQRLLRPNAVLSRQYSRPGDPDLRVLFVHCGDARDMIGHYPPVCYPASGWVQEPLAGEEDDELVIDGRVVPVRVYRFLQTHDRGRQDQIRIFSGFVLPDGTITRRIDDINDQAERRAVSAQGVAQFQIISDARFERARSREAAEGLLAGMEDLLRALRIQGEVGEQTAIPDSAS